MNAYVLNTYILLALCIILIIIIILRTSREGMSFTDDYMKDAYKRMNVYLDPSEMSITSSTGKKVYYIYNSNSLASREICNNKAITSQVLTAHDIPVAEFFMIRKSKQISVTQQLDVEMKRTPLRYPLVVKPIDGTHGTNVIIGIRNFKELSNTVADILETCDAVIIEEFLSGHDHRALVINGQVVDLVRRDYINIRGDGTSTIRQLINSRNQKQKNNGDHATHNIDWSLISRESNGKGGDDVLEVGKEIMISNVRNYHNGANIIRINLNEVHPDNLELLRRVNSAIGLNVAGVDFMVPNISQSYKSSDNRGYIIEVNSNPGLDIHVNPKDDRSHEMGELVVRSIFL